MEQMMARFPNFYSLLKVKIRAKIGKKAQYASNKSKELFKRKKYFEVRCTLTGSVITRGSEKHAHVLN